MIEPPSGRACAHIPFSLTVTRRTSINFGLCIDNNNASNGKVQIAPPKVIAELNSKIPIRIVADD